MSQQRIARMIADHQAAMARQDDPDTRATICEMLRGLEALAITEGQALRRLATTGARSDDPARQALYQQAIAESLKRHGIYAASELAKTLPD